MQTSPILIRYCYLLHPRVLGIYHCTTVLYTPRSALEMLHLLLNLQLRTL